MSDKFRRTAPLVITFASAERPTGAKLSALATQTRNALGLLEKAIGDPWEQAGDPWLTSYSLQITNLARAIGQGAALNPAIYALTGDAASTLPSTFNFTETMNVIWGGKDTGYLLYKPSASAVQANFVEGGGNGIFTTLVASEHLVVSAGQYWIDTATGKFRVYAPLDPNLVTPATLTYPVAPIADWAWDMDLIPGVIPDPRQSTFTSCRVATVGGKFYILLPPRQPLTLAAKDAPPNYPVSGDVSQNEASSLDINALKFWQSPTVAALPHEHYHYSLPKEIRPQLTNFPAGTALPDGFLYLYDLSTKTIVENITFKIPTDVSFAGLNWVLEVSSSTYDFSPKVTGSETEGSYSSTQLAIITNGAPVARQLQRLTSAFLNHGHDQGHQESVVSHTHLGDLNPPVAANNEHSSRYPTYLPAWPASNWNFDDHTHLLSRAGSQGAGRTRDVNNNAMLGDLVLASSVGAGGNFLNNTSASRKLYFGGTTSSPNIHAPTAQQLAIFGDTSNSTPSVGLGTSTPGAHLHIKGAHDIFVKLESTSSSSFDQALIFADPTATWWVGQKFDLSDAFGIGRSNAKSDLVIDSAGRVGLGTGATSLTSQLYINAGTLGGTAGNTLDVLRLGMVDATSELTEFSFVDYRGTTSALFSSADQYFSKFANGTYKGFLGFYGSSGSIPVAGVGIGFNGSSSFNNTVTPTLFVASNGVRVGSNATAITSGPLSTLEVVGTVTVSAQANPAITTAVTGDVANATINLRNSGIGNLTITPASTSGSVQRDTIVTAGHVGIGTNINGSPLTDNVMVQEARASAAVSLTLNNTSSTSPSTQLKLNTNSYTWSIRNDSSNNFFIKDENAGVDRITIRNVAGAGNVGINTANPLAQLSVGAGSVANTSYPVQISTTGAGSTAFFAANVNGALGASFGYSQAGDISSVTGAILKTVDNSALYLATHQIIGITMLPNQNVGLGTLTPNSTLHVNSVTTPAVRIDMTGGNAVIDVNAATATQQAIVEFLDRGTVTYKVGKQTNNNFFMNDTIRDFMTYNPSTKILALNPFSWPVAIGSATANASLDVFGGNLASAGGSELEVARFGGNDSNQTKLRVVMHRMTAGSDWGTDNIHIVRQVDTTNQGFLSFAAYPVSGVGIGYGTPGATPFLFVHNNQNVGIGTVVPNNRLSVFGSASFGNWDPTMYVNSAAVQNKFGVGFAPLSTSQALTVVSPSANIVSIGGTNTLIVPQNSGSGSGAIYFGDVEGNQSNCEAGIEVSRNNSNDPTLGIGVTRDGLKGNILIQYDGRTFIRNGGSNLATFNTNGHHDAVLWNTTSDAKYKENVTDLEPVLDKVLALRPVRYFWNSLLPYAVKDVQVGFIAQEVQAVFPEFVHTAGEVSEEPYLSLDYARMTAVLVQAIKELKTEVNDLRAQLAQK